ncbi:hypothetical protein BKA70DRAFT_305549 [Coprinopsis sp. MPI-PUGE-AT-0042]|nr:hypothetical protein BKA70DRAFT_305549 [Coprinopsis sp. MPI-PUGE-AT-0042]
MEEEERARNKNMEEKQNGQETERPLTDTAAVLAICAGSASAGVISRVFAAHSLLLVSLASPTSTLDPESLTNAPSLSSSCLSRSATSSAGKDEGTISVNLRDARLDNQDYGSVGAQTWGRGCGRNPHTSQLGCRRRDVEIVATDYYPSVLENLEVNLQSNGFASTPDQTNAVTSNHLASTVPNVSLKSCSLYWSTFASPASFCSSPSSPNDSH